MIFDDYHEIQGISRSQLWDFYQNPKMFHWKHILKRGYEVETLAMKIGSALHCALLEPELFSTRYIKGNPLAHEYHVKFLDLLIDRWNAKKDIPQIALEDKEFFVGLSDFQEGELAYLGRCAGYTEKTAQAKATELLHNPVFIEYYKTCIRCIRGGSIKPISLSDKEYDGVVECHAELCKHPLIQKLYESDKVLIEQSLTFQLDGELCKFKPDAVFEDSETGNVIILDLKFIHDIAYTRKHFVDFGYWFQASFYSVGMTLTEDIPEIDPSKIKFVFLFVEKNPPYSFVEYEMSESQIRDGFIKIRETLKKLQQSRHTNHYPSKAEMMNMNQLLSQFSPFQFEAEHDNLPD